MKIVIEGRLTAGYYNDMEAGHPVFIDGDSLSDCVKEKLKSAGLDPNFCYGPFQDSDEASNPLVGKRVTLTLDIHEDT